MKKAILSISLVFVALYSNSQALRVDTIGINPSNKYFMMETPSQLFTVVEFQTPDYEKGEQPVLYDFKSKKSLRIGKKENLNGGAGCRIVTSTIPDPETGIAKLIIYKYQNEGMVVEKVIERDDYIFAREITDQYMVITNVMDASVTKMELYNFSNGKLIPIEMPANEYELIQVSFNLEEGIVAFAGSRRGEDSVGDIWVCDLSGKRLYATKVTGTKAVVNYLSCISRDQILVSNFGENLLLDSKGGSTNISDNGRKFFIDLRLSSNLFFGHYSDTETGVLDVASGKYTNVPNQPDFSLESIHVSGLDRGYNKVNVLDLSNNSLYINGENYNINLGGNLTYFNSVFSKKYNLLISKFHNYVYVLKPIKS